MLKRTIEVSTDGTSLFLRAKQLVIERDGDELASVPFDDLGFLVLTSHGVTISSGALRACAEYNVAVISCAENFLPAGLQLPLAANSLHAERLNAQVAVSVPLRKQLWSRIVNAKLRMQAANLPEGPARSRILAMAGDVRSGDPDNLEAQGARIYWGELFSGIDLPAPFRREPDGPPPNGLLNYGYAIVRACVARALVAAGLHPALGLHHQNRYNAFCLADDLIEPFRPFVDGRVRELAAAGELEVNKDTKRPLLALLADKLTVGGEQSPLMIGVQRSANSLSNLLMEAVKGEDTSAPKLADLLELPGT